MHGFARVRCESCKDELLVAFSCKGRGVCPSCNAKRAHVTAVHLVERVVLPHVPYRQWTLSFAHRVRWVLQGRGTTLGRPHPLPAHGVRPAVPLDSWAPFAPSGPCGQPLVEPRRKHRLAN
ncbi:transposase zinc-binding domain-containing protein [Pyxidicoccus sp. MSG2]|nr:transposase zinc-binding domain-containing protein [Pyxidicoccus sp. MSG2]MCY1014515.1 transposase zinc-binding domain-containing protein [Pyxidicoccus sp. MSG2]